MADGLCSGDLVGNVIKTSIVKDYEDLVTGVTNDSENGSVCEKVNSFYLPSDSNKLFDKLVCGDSNDGKSTDKNYEEFLHSEDDCRKKRCVDRYDSSESSDSGVAILSCTDCSGSSTASSDITDPGSPFSTASSHSEDSASQPVPKMPPTQNAHHPPWSWTTEEGQPDNKRSILIEKTAFPKRLKSNEDSASKQSPPCLHISSSTSSSLSSTLLSSSTSSSSPSSSLSGKRQMILASFNTPSQSDTTKFSSAKKTTKKPQAQLQQNPTKQGKITEYFKSQIKYNINRKDPISKNSTLQTKSVSLVDQQTQFNGIRSSNPRLNSVKKAAESSLKSKKLTVPRKILPAPSKHPENSPLNHHPSVNTLTNFSPTVALTAVTFPSNLTYIHNKTPKPQENSIFVPQFATIGNDKISAIPIISRTPCINVIHQPLQKITTINNFNCVKLNATVVPIVKLNTLSSRSNGTTRRIETTVPTVHTAAVKSQKIECAETPKQNTLSTYSSSTTTSTNTDPIKVRLEEASRQLEGNARHKIQGENSSSSSPADSDSGISFKDNLLEISTDGDNSASTPQKSPILSQPKTIRFPPNKQVVNEELKEIKTTHSQDSGWCRWNDCSARFETSGALLEHLQVKHVISQATQEQYVCLWMGCKVHGRRSCSRSWLERHVLAHAGTKPFRCIVDGCGQRFNSQLTLERHVNGHFTGDGTLSNNIKKPTENSTTKLFKRNGKRIRFRRQPWSARMFDFIDAGIMEGLQHKLLTMTHNRTLGQMDDAGNCVTVLSQVVARRVGPDGIVKFLIRWHPSNILPEEWVSEKEYVTTKSVPISSLEPSAKDAVQLRLFFPERTSQKQRRKPPPKQQT